MPSLPLNPLRATRLSPWDMLQVLLALEVMVVASKPLTHNGAHNLLLKTTTMVSPGTRARVDMFHLCPFPVLLCGPISGTNLGGGKSRKMMFYVLTISLTIFTFHKSSLERVKSR